jgi:crotonobetainyl-CoA:carnitine CoA-transferase CaiB-like acyl-CoA transferase
VVEIDRIGDGPPATASAVDRPAAGLRVLDLTRVIAGPVATRTLAAHGADVLRIGAPHLYDHPTLVSDTGFGKRSAYLDLGTGSGRSTLHALVRGADVVIQGYRPGSLADRGLAPEELATLRPGIVYVSLCAYGRLGPWAQRRGFDSLVQMVSGIATAGRRVGGEGVPHPLPAQALDHATGYLAAFGAMAALERRHREGGSWRVQVSLARTAAWLCDMGHVDALGVHDPGPGDIDDLLSEAQSPFGTLRYVRPPGDIVGMTPRWDRASVPLGYDPPTWTP